MKRKFGGFDVLAFIPRWNSLPLESHVMMKFIVFLFGLGYLVMVGLRYMRILNGRGQPEVSHEAEKRQREKRFREVLGIKGKVTGPSFIDPNKPQLLFRDASEDIQFTEEETRSLLKLSEKEILILILSEMKKQTELLSKK